MLSPRVTPHAITKETQSGWQLHIPEGMAGIYRLAQLDNYSGLRRKDFPINSPASLNLSCRTSSTNLPGTWGFGFWNDPFAFSLGLQGANRRLPVLPNSCWFFNASPENHLSFHDRLPGSGFLAQSFRSPRILPILMIPGILGAPLLMNKSFSKWLRGVLGSIIAEDSQQIDVDTTLWHEYALSWTTSTVSFSLDHSIVFQSEISPHGPLGVVIWIDNQYAAWTPTGKISLGTLEQKSAGWIEVEHLIIKS